MIAEDSWPHFILAACPGELGEPVALAVAEQVIKLGYRRATDAVEVRWLEQVAAGTDLQATADHLAGLLSSLDRTDRGDGGVTLVLDVARLGKALVELLIRAGRVPRMVEVTAGTRGERSKGGALLLPRRELAAGLAVALNAGKLRVAPGLELAERFARALAGFQTRPVRSPDPFDAARQEADDRLVLAVGLCAWMAGTEVPGLRGTGPSAARSLMGDYDPHEAWHR